MAIQIKKIDMAQLERVIEIERSAYPLPWSESMLSSSLSKDQCWGLFNADQLLGYAFLSFIVDEAHLLNICIDPRYARQGLGRQLLAFVLAKSIENKSSVMFLEVRVSNTSAIALYHSEGFNEVGVRPNYYPLPDGKKEDALLMTLELSVSERV